MNTVLRAFLLFVILLVLALLLGQAGSVPIPVSVQFGSLTLQTTAPVAITLLVAVLLAAFYLGRFTGWLIRLPRNLFRRRGKPVEEALADAYTALALNDHPAALAHVKGLKPDSPAHADLLTLLHLSTSTLPLAEAQKTLENPRLALVTILALARTAATQGNWEEVKRLATHGRQFAPENPTLLALQFKALVNLNDPAAAELLPALKPHLGAARHKLLTQVLQGPNALNARPVLDAPWVKAFEHWLPTPSETFPD